jgi:membrane associated rhomboid family serine protease
MFRNIPTVTKNLLIINVLAFLAMLLLEMRGIDLADIGGLHFFLASDFRLWQLVTYLFLHANLSHIFFNMFALWMFGCVIENVWGPKKFLFYYIFCGVGAGLIQELAQLVSFYLIVSSQTPDVGFGGLISLGYQYATELNGWTTIGASGAVYAILLAFGMTFPNERIFIFPLPVPIKAKWFVLGYVAIELFMALQSSGDNVAHTAHLGGMLFGFLLIRYWTKHPDSRYNRSSGQEFFDNLKRSFDRRKHPQPSDTDTRTERGSSKEDDWNFNAQKKARQDEIDAILDKIRKSGYDSLTKDEKKRLFEASKEI